MRGMSSSSSTSSSKFTFVFPNAKFLRLNFFLSLNFTDCEYSSEFNGNGILGFQNPGCSPKRI